MRVIHVAPTPFGSTGLLGGGERYPLELARALAARIQCELITFGPEAREVPEAGGLRLRIFRSLTSWQGHPAHALAPSLPLALEGADVIHTHHMRSAASQIAAVAARARRRRVVTTDHGLQGPDWNGLLPRLFHGFLTVSTYSAHELHVPADRVRVIYGGADPQRFAPDASVRRAGVLFVGRITPHKGIDRLMAALPPGVQLSIVGSSGHDPDPPERDYPQLLRRMAANRQVRFLGPVTDDVLATLYRQASVLVLPSVQRTCYGRSIAVSELLGLVVLEAMASGTPVVCSSVGGLPEVVRHGDSGYLVEPGNVAELHERLTEILRNPRLATRMGRCARELVLEGFTWQACADRCLSAYAEL